MYCVLNKNVPSIFDELCFVAFVSTVQYRAVYFCIMFLRTTLQSVSSGGTTGTFFSSSIVAISVRSLSELAIK